MDDWSAVISSANSLIDTAKWAAEFTQTTQLQDKQNQFNLDMWNLQNEYNSPQAQMQRFQEAGLNPNLMYSQGTAGNNANAPAKNVPDYSRSWDRLSRTFNLVNLMNSIAELKKNSAEAQIAEIQAERDWSHMEGDKALASQYDYDMQTGMYIPHVDSPDGVTVYKYPLARYYKLQHLEDNFKSNALFPFRSANLSALTGSVPYRNALLEAQRNYLVPQTTIANYEAAHIPWSFWIGQGSKAVGAATNLVGAFNPKNWILNLGRRGGAYRAPGGKIYYY